TGLCVQSRVLPGERHAAEAPTLLVATEASKKFLAGDRFTTIRFGNACLEFGELFRREVNRLLTFTRDDQHVSAISDGRIVQDDLARDNGACSDSHIVMVLPSAPAVSMTPNVQGNRRAALPLANEKACVGASG